ncbi:hypothetical protein PZB21_25940 [Rhizobium sp. CBK13]|uniref:hypothetical protein n=1 Tax=Rhizobium sp. CBK13 TaxID=3031399 RepID=UPI0023AFA9C4|nr:hypothetical protein [Rhizobium sp. CBK13]MDE8762615.1 hypothetical protein [Rhizobium sp. CBK13]
MSFKNDDTIGLEFLPNSAGEAEGLGDAGIETFRDKPFAAVARETGQNSRDARDVATAPVKLTFDELLLKSDDIPSIASYRSAAKLCLEKASKVGSEKDIGFFKQAVKALDAPEVRVMRVADFNTKGVRGPCEEGKPFHTLAKADGMSVKDGVNSGGSFGIGKSAISALSDIQTAFYSTRYSDAQGSHVLCMGKTLFISHTGADGEERRRKGYWGKKKGFMPLDNPADIPDWLLRKEQGTSIYSLCVRENRIDWRYEMVAALLINFFAAIQRQEMEFEIDDGFLKINRNTIEALFGDNKVIEAVDQLKARAAFETARTLYGCLVDEKTILRTLDVKGLGKVNLRILLREKLGYTIGIIRNGMFITDNLANFGEPFKRFPLYREFALVIEPDGSEEGQWFKRLENPSHNDLSAERITDPSMRQQGQKAFEQLAGQVRETLKELAKTQPTASMELEELNEFFASEESQVEDELGTETDPRSLKPTPVKVAQPKPKKRVKQPRGEDDDGPGPAPDNDPDPEPNPNPNPTPDPGPVKRKARVAEPIDLQRERNLLSDRTNPRLRKLIFTSPVEGDISISIEASGLSNPERLAIQGAKSGTVNGGDIILPCKKGERVTIEVELETAYAGPIEFNAFRIHNDEEAGEI